MHPVQHSKMLSLGRFLLITENKVWDAGVGLAEVREALAAPSWATLR